MIELFHRRNMRKIYKKSFKVCNFVNISLIKLGEKATQNVILLLSPFKDLKKRF